MKRCSKRQSVFVVQLVLFFVVSSLFADEGALTSKTIDKFQSSFEMDTHTRAMYNSITNNDISSLALNREVLRRHNEIFSHKIETKGITNQKKSGRCWLFAGLNILRPKVIENNDLESFEFSQNYLAFWDKLEKANCFLENIIGFADRDILNREMEFLLRTPIPDGGYWENVVNLVEKYGAVPQEIMPETNSSGNTSMMNNLISRKLRADAVKLRNMHKQKKSLKKIRTEKTEMLAHVYKMLVLNLGQPPSEFQWRFEDANSVVSKIRTYSPKSFYKEFVGVDLGQYVDIFNDPSKEYGKHYSINLTRNVRDGDDAHFANVKMQILKDIAVKAVLDDEPIWFACDVGKDQSREHGIMSMGMFDYDSIYLTDMAMTKAQRSLFRESVPNHAMVFIGVDMQKDKPAKWLVENSWGDDKGSKGLWTIYDSWFDTNVYSIIVKKKYVPEDILNIYKQSAIKLPPWDPIYSFVQ
ncbi:MAG: C1 family peptidase [Planctomycetes bacterium]|nr:C1 family peptidase [Planctomycetota bacterium]MBL7146139.1 C1 family peptidase [Phycisphaerae bacterium]